MTDGIFLRTLKGEATERRPLWMLRQAGRYLPEYREIRKDHNFEAMSLNTDVAAEVTLQPIDRFGFDAAIVFADIMSPVRALGIPFSFNPGPVLEAPLRSRASIESLPTPDKAEIAPEVPATLAKVRAGLEERAAKAGTPRAGLIGFAAAPLTLACYLIEGRGNRDFPALRGLLLSDPALFGDLLEKVTSLTIEYLRAQYEAGADVVQIFDSWAGTLSARDWREHVQPHLSTLAEQLASDGIPTIMFANGAAHLSPLYLSLPSTVNQFCWRTDLPAMRDLTGAVSDGGKVLQGNLDPAALLAGPEATARAAQAILDRMPAHGHIFNLGHGIDKDTPLESVAALVETVHNESSALA
ncbi:MAG: uroporphyrinogen decarboxylase [Planctomycetes bacterium]|nr:uroporphyrinogen decarboxylase [Planctomycetota bacterium]